MIDLKLLEENYAETVKKLALKNVDSNELENLSSLMKERKKIIKERDALRTQLNNRSDEIKQCYSEGNRDKGELLKKEAGKLKEDVKGLESKLQDIQAKISYIHLRIPNLPHPDCPIGQSEEDNVVLKYEDYDESKYKGKTFQTHWELGEQLDILDLKAASEISGSMFALYKNQGARLLRALINFALDLNRDEYTEMVPPHFVSTDTFTSTGHLPKFADEAYQIEKDGLWAIPTGEVPLTNYGKNKIYDYNDLPIKMMAYTVCFRREAGSHGKDTRGLQRLHEFHKVEMVKYTRPDQTDQEFHAMVENAVKPLKLLKLPYRIVSLCTADLTFSSALMYDIEVYAPGIDKWLEVSSVGIFTDFQSRRANIRYREKDNKLNYIHALNGSAIATPRVFAAIMENYQLPDKTIAVPRVLQQYMNAEIIK